MPSPIENKPGTGESWRQFLFEGEINRGPYFWSAVAIWSILSLTISIAAKYVPYPPFADVLVLAILSVPLVPLTWQRLQSISGDSLKPFYRTLICLSLLTPYHFNIVLLLALIPRRRLLGDISKSLQDRWLPRTASGCFVLGFLIAALCEARLYVLPGPDHTLVEDFWVGYIVAIAYVWRGPRNLWLCLAACVLPGLIRDFLIYGTTLGRIPGWAWLSPIAALLGGIFGFTAFVIHRWRRHRASMGQSVLTATQDKAV